MASLKKRNHPTTTTTTTNTRSSSNSPKAKEKQIVILNEKKEQVLTFSLRASIEALIIAITCGVWVPFLLREKKLTLEAFGAFVVAGFSIYLTFARKNLKPSWKDSSRNAIDSG